MADPVTQVSRRVTVIALLLSLAMLPFATDVSFADDIPDSAQKSIAKVREYLASGEKKNLRKAWTRLKRLRPDCTRSIDFWELHLQVAKAMGKDDAKAWADIETAEKANQGCPTFELLRARVTTDMYERQEHLEKAVEIAPKDMRPKLALIDHLLATDEEIDAEELVDAILEKDPANAEALVRKGRVQMAGGYFNAAVTFVDEQVKTTPLPELFDLKAQAYLGIHQEQEKPEALEEAHKAATKAVGIRADAEFVSTLAQVLERQDKITEARDLVAKHFEASGEPLLAGLLGDYAFRTGDYVKAAKAFEKSAATSPRSAKGLVECHLRLGKEKDALRAVAFLSSKDHASYKAIALGRLQKFAEARALLAELEDEDKKWTELWLHAAEGKPDAMKSFAEDLLGDDGLGGEWYTLYLIEALVRRGMGPNAVTGFRNQVRKALAATAAKKLAPAEAPEGGYDMSATTHGLMRRIPAYYVSVCGTRFRAAAAPQRSGEGNAETKKLKLFWAVHGVADCKADAHRVWRFNAVEAGAGGSVNLSDMDPKGDWAAVKEDYLQGCNHLVEGKPAAAVKCFDNALTVEPNWHRIKLFRAAALALADESQRKRAGEDALKAMKAFPDDLSGRYVALLIAAYGGVDIIGALSDYATHQETHSDRDLSRL